MESWEGVAAVVSGARVSGEGESAVVVVLGEADPPAVVGVYLGGSQSSGLLMGVRIDMECIKVCVEIIMLQDSLVRSSMICFAISSLTLPPSTIRRTTSSTMSGPAPAATRGRSTELDRGALATLRGETQDVAELGL